MISDKLVTFNCESSHDFDFREYADYLVRILIQNRHVCNLPYELDCVINNGRDLKSTLCEISKSSRPRSLEITHDYELTDIPDSICNFTELTSLSFFACSIENIRESIFDLINLTYLNLAFNKITNISHLVGNLGHLTKIIISNNKITELPESIGDLKSLKIFSAPGNKITRIPHSIGKLTQMKLLDVSNNKITQIPDSLGNATNLRTLILARNKITMIPESIGKLINLKNFHITRNGLVFPGILGDLESMREFTFSSDTTVFSASNLPYIPSAARRLRNPTHTVAAFGKFNCICSACHRKYPKITVTNAKIHNKICKR